ncbi:recombination protein RecR [Campylobacter volucris]|uniref:recombination mediator RecR n=1 Tax=Campylobacter volucris TaxID=1031542 RepID=UPI0018A04AFD|nr:recombination mediator RecR [Campylobacter volucris]MBF7043829.1 recombination protein RecR [Campylobacter volucris]MBF7047779.1 recombination protein RecR [Campylobacter volucris]MBF7048568.1 recombination protein RecR [Campylobacter volucris]MBF7060897.1 recombination protein RecR [Campylobacter volucris]MBF7068941.1 recombination protein RecR [Campylobacter volucris]
MKGVEKFNELVKSFASLPTIGKKTALRLAYHVCIKDPLLGSKLAYNIEESIRMIRKCSCCGALSENELCEICLDDGRNKNIICIVQSPKDILTLEESGSFDGYYFVLEEANDECIDRLKAMILKQNAKELFFAFTQGINSDALVFYIEEKLKSLKLTYTQIAQGIPSGVSLENVDFISLHKAINHRTKLD